MANGAFFQGSGITLEVDKFDAVFGFAAGGYGVGAVMACFAVHTAVPGRFAVKSIILFEFGICVAVITARLIQPGIGIQFDLIQAAVA